MSRLTMMAILGGALLASAPLAAKPPSWKALPFPPQESHWEASQFGGDGEVHFQGDRVELESGYPLTGIRYTGEIPRDLYEIQLQARRLEGIDFFCGLTFPVGEGRCSLILGGWAGAITGLSNIDGADASDNATTRFGDYEDGRWYHVRLRVDAERIRAWVDQRLVVDQPREGHQFDIRPEVHPSLPLGIAAFECRAEIRDVQLRALEPGR